jgi:hypothetical protein
VEVAAEAAELMGRQLGWAAGQQREEVSRYLAWAAREGLAAEANVRG